MSDEISEEANFYH